MWWHSQSVWPSARRQAQGQTPKHSSHTRTMEQGSPTLNLNEVEAQEAKEHMYAAGGKVAGGPQSGGGRRVVAAAPGGGQWAVRWP